MEDWLSGKKINILPRPLDGECNLFRQINKHMFPFPTPGELIGARSIWQKKLAHDYKLGHRTSSRCISYPVPTCSVIMWAVSAGHWQGERSWICPLKHSAGEQRAQEFTFIKVASSAGSTRCAEAAALWIYVGTVSTAWNQNDGNAASKTENSYSLIFITFLVTSVPDRQLWVLAFSLLLCNNWPHF